MPGLRTYGLYFYPSLLLIAIACFGQSIQAQGSMPSATPSQEIGPLYTNYRGVTVGMTTAEAREKLGKPKAKSKQQDFFVLSKMESTQIVYLDGKVRTVSVDYVGADSGAPTAMEVLGVELKPGKNGNLYQLVRYPAAGYWVAYSRTAGKSPVVSITMRKMRTPKQ